MVNLIEIITPSKCLFCTNDATTFVILKGSGRSIPLCGYHSILLFQESELTIRDEETGSLNIRGDNNVKKPYGS